MHFPPGLHSFFVCTPMTKKFIPELLAPVGKPSALRAAVFNGADAVYLGEKNFSARKNAANFTSDEIRDAVRFCHTYGVKLHLALNTLIHDYEMKRFEQSVNMCAELGVDAVIVQDLGAARLIGQICPELEMHASTQLTACNIYDVAALEELGFSRVVLSRELSEKEISNIRRQTSVELEVFVHGALCISFSGKCLMSSFIGGRSGNRGECAQPCRKLYAHNGRAGYFLSPRDLCLAGEISKLSSLGINSLKIEGRMKSPEYVAAVVGTYRKYLDNPAPLSQSDRDNLKKIFVRGTDFTTGFFCEKNTPEIMNYTANNDNLSSRADAQSLKRARATFADGANISRVPVTAYFSAKKGERACLRLDDGRHSATVYGSVPQAAQKSALTRESILFSLSKLGQTPFILEKTDIFADGGLFMSAAELNALRRDAANRLVHMREEITPLNTYSPVYSKKIALPAHKPYICAQISTPEQYFAATQASFVAVPLGLWGKIDVDARCILLLPPVLPESEKVKAVLSKTAVPKYGYASSLGAAKLLKEYNIIPIADFGMNVFNAEAANLAQKTFSKITLSPELSLTEISYITAHTNAPCEAVCYGKQAVMVSRACLIRGIKGKCDCRPITISDKTGAEFTLFGDSVFHLNTVVNSRPTFTADKLSELSASGLAGFRLCFTDELAEETKRIISMYNKTSPAIKPKLYTRGYFFK